jgi:hypothetical protein
MVLVVLFISSLTVYAAAEVEKVTVPQGAEVVLIFDKAVSSKTAKAGDAVAMHVRDDVKISDKVVLKSGTKVTGAVAEVTGQKRYGVNAKLRIVLNPVQSAYDGTLTLEPRSKGRQVGGKKTNEAAGATAGGAIVLGPVGLAGGYFIRGKAVQIKVGDQLVTEVSKTTILQR